MTLQTLRELGLTEVESGALIERWEAREAEHTERIETLMEELEAPLRLVGLVPGESADGLPEADGFLAGFRGY